MMSEKPENRMPLSQPARAESLEALRVESLGDLRGVPVRDAGFFGGSGFFGCPGFCDAGFFGSGFFAGSGFFGSD
ncbi:hypothetical protein [Agromyces neolithicus]|uniref:hypothetical protein n=1 Tax=Agromyces neolithicus TaxID=269420 RepID=UPI0031DC2332